MNDELLQPRSLDAPQGPEENKNTGKKKPPVLWIVLLLLAGVLIGIRMLSQKAGEESVAVPTPTPLPVPTATPDPTLRMEAEAALEQVLELIRVLRPAEPERWAGERWKETELAIERADALMAEAKYPEAAALYTETLPALKSLKERLPSLPGEIMPQAFGAYAQGKKEDAVALLQIVLFLEPEHEKAKNLLPRAEKADQSFALLQKAKNYAGESQWDLAFTELTRLKDLDEEFPGGSELRKQVQDQLMQQSYRKWMAEALLAFENEDWVTAEACVKKARDFDPGDKAAMELEQQIKDRRVQQKVLTLKREAEVLTYEEKWSEAHKKWLEMKALDPKAPWIQEGLEQSLKWELIAEKIRKGMADPGSVQTGLWVKEMQEREGWPANLSAKAEALTERWRLAVTPVEVQLKSDHETQVEIAGVGRWKPFVKKEILLKPGSYVAKGWRYGYRDVRVPFEVKPGQQDLVVEVICVEGL